MSYMFGGYDLTGKEPYYSPRNNLTYVGRTNLQEGRNYDSYPVGGGEYFRNYTSKSKVITKDQMIQKIMTKVRQMTKAQLKKLLTKLNKIQRFEGFNTPGNGRPMVHQRIKEESLNVPPPSKDALNHARRIKLNKLNKLKNKLSKEQSWG